MTEPKTEAPKGKDSEFFAAVRARGILNAMLDGPALRFEKNNKGFRCRWEYGPPNGDKTLVVAREAMGFRIVQAEELGTDFTASEQSSGPVRRGDLVLMCAPEEIVNEIEYDDAKRAYEDWKLPETSYKDHLRSIKVRTRDGATIGTQSRGGMERKEEVIEGLKEPQHELEKGGE